MASSSSSVEDIHTKHDVFISFSGKDTRRGFLSHLVKELRRAKIIAYVDDRMNRGEEISASLLNAIQQSHISVVIFSQNYASSRWCLDELAKIDECAKAKKQVVLPVFYYIDPSHVRNQKGPYESAFPEHELKFPFKVQNWRLAMKNAADLSGYDSSHLINDSVLIDEIVKDVSLRLDRIYLSESRGLVGINRYVTEIGEFLETKSKDVLVIGIHGQSGIGKTTLAQLAYDKFSSRYEGSYFLDDVGEESRKHGLESLREKLISELQEGKSTIVLKNLLSRRKVLVVLDGVDSPEQLNHLATEGICWGPGSRVIVTTRSMLVLRAKELHRMYRLQPLDIESSVKLFSLNAFKNSHHEKDYEEFLKRALVCAQGLPLAIKVLGLGFYTGDREAWESKLKELERYPIYEWYDLLRMSFDELEDVERDIFLDIAFFYSGEDKGEVIRLLDANNPFSSCGVKRLLDRGLISISHDNKIQMHGLIQKMGWAIVKDECREHPEKRSRLKDPEEVFHVIKNNKGTDAIKGIVIYASHLKDVQLNVDTFKSMQNLRVVKFYSPWHERSFYVHHPKNFGLFSNESIRYPFM